MTVRFATLNDLDGIAAMGAAMIAEGSYSIFTLDTNKVRKTIETLITHGCAMVLEKDGLIVGAMLGDVVEPWFSSNRMGIEYGIYIEPKHRTGMAAARLINGWKKWCKDHGAIQARPGVTTGDKSVCRLYKAMGFETVGAVFKTDL